jgi:hypothetical protein
MFNHIFKKSLVGILIAAGLLVSFSFTSLAAAPFSKNTCAVYVTGIGCPHCAEVDPLLFEEYTAKYPELTIIEYEIYQDRVNAGITVDYDAAYETGFGVPMLIIDDGEVIVGDKPILNGFDEAIANSEGSCPLLTGPQKFSNVNFATLPRSPKIWTKNRILIPAEDNRDNTIAKKLLATNNIPELLENYEYSKQDAEPVPYSGGEAEFENAVIVGGWLIQWNGEDATGGTITDINDPLNPDNPTGSKLTIGKLISLAIVDAINPCALAVLTLMLVSIMAYNPGKKRKVLFAGLAFTLSVFLMYLVYGLIIIKFLQLVQAITTARLYVYNGLAVVAIILGLLNIKDFIKYRPGTLGTEMPLFMRPKMQAIVSRVTSPRGAFIVGLFVTVFLLPCTIGPYVIAGGILSTYELIKTIPPLLLYNFIFVLPMLVITVIIYKGMSRVDDVSEWKSKNIRYLHLIAGLIMFLLGVAMLMGWA